MPDRPPLSNHNFPDLEATQSQKASVWDRVLFSTLGQWRRKEGGSEPQPCPAHQHQNAEKSSWKSSAQLGPSRSVVPELPRPATFRRQNSEQRDRLLPQKPCVAERRAVSVGRKRASSAFRPNDRSLPRAETPRRSAPVVASTAAGAGNLPREQSIARRAQSNRSETAEECQVAEVEDGRSLHGATSHNDLFSDVESATDPLNDPNFREELAQRWILNLSMHFRDRSEREKFIVTFAEHPTKWRRVTVSCDYRNAETGSLEANLKELGYQRDKNAYIYDAIRESLPDIKFYDTVTNLKLETRAKRLHVHVTEDVNEIVRYPSLSAIQHLHLRSDDRFLEKSICFEAHQSGFVYKVSVQGRYYIKKEIPSPDTVDEFLYEINALTALRSSKHVIHFRGVVVDDEDSLIKGLLIDFAEQGALVDLIFDHQKVPLPWTRREKWAKQIIEGLQDIHECGFVQGDFTLSNIVIDANDNAKIIDINRRGCPVGWEPPEFIGLITSGQRVSMYIGIKSDLYQLGMVLWGLAMLCDEPEREEGPLDLGSHNTNVPEYFCELVNSCLSETPAHRMSARELLLRFPRHVGDLDQAQVRTVPNATVQNPMVLSPQSNLSDRFNDSEEHQRLHPGHARAGQSHADGSYVDGLYTGPEIDVSITATGSHLELQGGCEDSNPRAHTVPDTIFLEESVEPTLDDRQHPDRIGLPFLDRSSGPVAESQFHHLANGIDATGLAGTNAVSAVNGLPEDCDVAALNWHRDASTREGVGNDCAKSMKSSTRDGRGQDHECIQEANDMGKAVMEQEGFESTLGAQELPNDQTNKIGRDAS